MSNTNTAAVASFPTFQILTLIFVTLKLTHVIAWSWWWVLSPLWIPLLVIAGVLFVFGLVALSIAIGTAALG